MQVIERNKMNEFMKQYVEMSMISPEMAAKIQEEFPIEQVLQKFKVVNGYDDQKLVADTKKDKIRKKNEKKLKELQDLLTLSTQNAIPEQTQGGTEQNEAGM